MRNLNLEKEKMKKFRNSLFGFNRDDVLSFVVESKEIEHKKSVAIKELEEKISKVEEDYKTISEKYSDTSEKLALAEAKIKDFESREAEITRLGESIGRLYLVAQANAGSILTAAKENAEISKISVEKNMAAATDAETELSEISRLLNEKTRSYIAEIAELKRLVADTKEKIVENSAKISDISAESDKVLKGVTE